MNSWKEKIAGVRDLRTKIAAFATVLGLGALGGYALATNHPPASQPQPVATEAARKPQVIRRTVHRVRHLHGAPSASAGPKPAAASAPAPAAPPPAAPPPPPTAAPTTSQPLVTGASGSAATASTASPSPIATSTSGASATSSSSSTPVSTRTSGGGESDGGEHGDG